MKHTIRKVLYHSMVICLIFLWSVSSTYGQTLFIGSKEIPESSLTKREIKDIFLGKKRKWKNNDDIIIAVMYKSPEHKDFVRTYLRKNTSQFISYWKNRVFVGTGRFPKSFENEDALIRYIEENHGVIGYIPSSIAVNNSVKIFGVDDD